MTLSYAKYKTGRPGFRDMHALGARVVPGPDELRRWRLRQRGHKAPTLGFRVLGFGNRVLGFRVLGFRV
jgi:hypothetical protein